MKTPADQPGLPELHYDAEGLPADHGDEAEAIQRAAALAWVAESDPIDAAPAGSLDRVRDTLGLAAKARGPQRWAWPLAAAAGWAAAAGLALFARSDTAPSGEGVAAIPSGASPTTTVETKEVVVDGGSVTPITDIAALREEIADLRAGLGQRDERRPGIHRPVIVELAAPGVKPAPATRERILDLIATALENELDLRTGRDAAEVVIERGWADWGTSNLSADTVFRHRAFPVDRVVEAGLLSGPDDQYLDPSNDWLWAPDPDTGDYIGRAAPVELERIAFVQPGNLSPGGGLVSEQPSHEEMPIAAVTSPTGYFVGAGDGRSIVALNDLPPVPPGRSLDLVTTDATGQITTYSVPDAEVGGASRSWDFSGTIPASAGRASANLMSFSVQTYDPASGDVSVILEGGDVVAP